MNQMLYFGCIDRAGHYLWLDERTTCANKSALKRFTGIAVTDAFLHSLDGTYAPDGYVQGRYKECLVPPFRIIAWNDFTVDTRPGSNSILLGIGYASADEMLNDAVNRFPSVMRRQTAPLHPES